MYKEIKKRKHNSIAQWEIWATIWRETAAAVAVKWICSHGSDPMRF